MLSTFDFSLGASSVDSVLPYLDSIPSLLPPDRLHIVHRDLQEAHVVCGDNNNKVSCCFQIPEKLNQV